MAKNKGKGGKNRRRGKNDHDNFKRELIVKEEGQEYAQVARMLGNGRLEALCIDGQKRLCHIRGKLRKKVWINAGDLILLGLRDFQDDKADVILRYLPEEARQLKSMGQIPAHVNITDIQSGMQFDRAEDASVIFDDHARAASSSDEDERRGAGRANDHLASSSSGSASDDDDDESDDDDDDEDDEDEDDERKKKNVVNKPSKFTISKRRQERRVFKAHGGDDDFISGV